MGRRLARQGRSALFPFGFHLIPATRLRAVASRISRTKNFICTLSKGLQLEVSSPSLGFCLLKRTSR